MKRLIALLCLLGFFNHSLMAQKYFTRTGEITFSSETPLEKIEAQNNSATSVIDFESGKMEFAVLIKAFQFEKALMQEHFNENYMESNQFPKSKFKGQIIQLSTVDLAKDGKYAVEVAGELTIHGVTQTVETTGKLNVQNGAIIGAAATFEVAVADYGIKIPAVVRDNIAKTVQIQVSIDNYQLLQ